MFLSHCCTQKIVYIETTANISKCSTLRGAELSSLIIYTKIHQYIGSLFILETQTLNLFLCLFVEKPKTVYTNAKKQLIIYSPPAILTLHLKRFQQNGYSFNKVNRHVDFSMVLDLAPYCSTLSQVGRAVHRSSPEWTQFNLIKFNMQGFLQPGWGMENLKEKS